MSWLEASKHFHLTVPGQSKKLCRKLKFWLTTIVLLLTFNRVGEIEKSNQYFSLFASDWKLKTKKISFFYLIYPTSAVCIMSTVSYQMTLNRSLQVFYANFPSSFDNSFPNAFKVGNLRLELTVQRTDLHIYSWI